jgi:OmcA/MtrC family decaheme c-type cytochrome
MNSEHCLRGFLAAVLCLTVGACSSGDAKDCTVTRNASGAGLRVCRDGTSTVLPTPDAGPGDDGGVVDVFVKNVPLDFATLSDAEKAALDLKLVVAGISFSADGKAVVGFSLSDGVGNPIRGLPPGDLRFALLKLVPAHGGGNDSWVSYIAANPTSTAGTETAAAAATATSGALLEDGDGNYAYTFARNVLDGANAGTTYAAGAVHRLVIIVSESGNPFAPLNVVKDFIPATNVDVREQNEKVDGTACLECHSSFRAKAGGTGAFHAGTRYDLKTCVACHNEQRRFTAIPGTGTTPAVDLDATGTVDPTTLTWTGNAVLVNGQAVIDMPVFIHKIHMGEETNLKGGTYAGVAMPYETTYPQDVRNCDKCHRAPAAQADTFKTKPSRRACGSCHDTTTFLATAPAGRTLHAGGPQADDSSCATCHPAGGTQTGILETHMAVAPPDPAATWLGGTNANTNAAFLPAAGFVPSGAAKLSYDLKRVTRDANKNPSIVFRFIKDGAPVVFNTPDVATELMNGFANSPSVYFAFAVPQDGIAAPADFNATASGYIKNIWNGTATGTGAGTMTFDAASGYYTITLTGVAIPDAATMLAGGVGYSYGLSSTPPLVQIDLPAYPYGDSSVIAGCIAGKLCGGLIVAAADVAMVATDAATGAAYAARRAIVDTGNCLKCHEQLGANPTFHAGQRNDGATCAFCHRPNQTSGGWSASSSTFVHSIHAAAMRTTGYNWHAACPANTSFADGTCTKDNADPYFAKVTYPGILNNCSQCHKPGTFDFSATASAAAIPNLLPSTVATGTYTAGLSTSPYVTVGVDYGTNFATANLTSGSKDGVACTTAAPCPCTLAAPCNASATTLVSSPVAAACSACHDDPTVVAHMQQMGGTFYGARTAALAQTEKCLTCHGPGMAVAIADVHK